MARESPPTLPMSSPITITLGSASSSRSSASRTAATKPSFRSVSARGAGAAPLRAEHRGQKVLGACVLVGEGQLDRELDLALDLAPDALDAVVVELGEVSEEPLEPRERILRLPFLDERRVAHVREVRPHGVLHPPERLQLEERRAVTLAGSHERARDCVFDGEDIVPVHDLARHPLARGEELRPGEAASSAFLAGTRRCQEREKAPGRPSTG